MGDKILKVKNWRLIHLCVGINSFIMVLTFLSLRTDLSCLIPLIVIVLGLAGVCFKNSILILFSILFSLIIGLFYLIGVLAVFTEGPISLNSDVMHIALPVLFISLNGLALFKFKRIAK